MAKTGYAQRIRERAAELRAMINAAQTELAELEVAERVLERLATDAVDDQNMGSDAGRRTKEPTIADMAVKLLTQKGPLATSDLLDYMREIWRPDLGDTTLTSTLSRTKNAGRIDLRDGKWFVPVDVARNENSGPAAPEEAKAEDASGIFGFHNPNFDRLGQ